MIITISREFGSGGRELGKRLSEALEIPYYDHEIIELIAKEHGFDEQYVNHLSEKRIQAFYSCTIGRRFATTPDYVTQQKVKIAGEKQKILEKFARQGDCLIIGRCADIILKEYQPFNVFVYADEAAKLKRCLERADEKENIKEKEILRMMRKIDKERAEYRAFYTDIKWGRKENYHLCVNTSGVEIKDLIVPLCTYIRAWHQTKANNCSDN